MQAIAYKTQQSDEESPNNNLSEWKVGPNYKLLKFRGEGKYGQVAKAKDLRTNETVAIKRI